MYLKIKRKTDNSNWAIIYCERDIINYEFLEEPKEGYIFEELGGECPVRKKYVFIRASNLSLQYTSYVGAIFILNDKGQTIEKL